VSGDGSYTYSLSATDKAGNAGKAVAAAIVVDTQNKAVRLSLDKRDFSPNGDGVADTVALLPESQSATVIRSWNLTVMDSGDARIRAYSGSGALPARLVWDGKQDSGNRAADGVYHALIEVRYVTDEVETARSVDIGLDTAAPAIELSAEDTLFSPDGDGRKDAVRFFQKTVPGDTWEGRVTGAGGETIRSWTWQGQADDFEWDGADAEGNKIPDGAYRYVVASSDPAGNTTERTVDRIVVDTRPTQVFITSSAQGFSPNGDGVADEQSFGLVVKLLDGIESWRLAMVDQSGVERRVFEGKGKASIPATQVWDGTLADGSVNQGEYTAVFTVDYLKGDRAVARSGAFTLDVEGPKVSLSTSPRYFSPDNDGVDDELKLSLAVADASVVDSWRFEIVEVAVVEGSGARKERPFFTWSGRGKPAERLVWDGRSQKGELVEAATDYPYRLTIMDTLGNKTVVEGSISVDVLVIRDGDRLKIKVPSIVFRAGFADFNELSQETLDRNAEVLKRIALILNRFKDYKIRVEGHANSVSKISRLSQAAIDKEETGELLKLSTERAEAVMKKLIEYGVDPKRLSVRGLGSSEPVVAFSDAENRWKNRRVEFILIKE
ncbi:MAG: OmpA family protein, partial [Spirochaetales bacterium]|nr:OmpA family protein [Spirochaetales bacterium]